MLGVGLPVAEQLKAILSWSCTVILEGLEVIEGRARLSTSVKGSEYLLFITFKKQQCYRLILTCTAVPSSEEVQHIVLKD